MIMKFLSGSHCVGSLYAALLFLCVCRVYPSPAKRDDPNPAPQTPPDTSKDAFPPYPNDKDIDLQNRRGTRLFGWKGCDFLKKDDIAVAYDDFYYLAHQKEVLNIDWKGQPAKDFFGPASGKKAVTDVRREEIQRKLKTPLPNLKNGRSDTDTEIFTAASEVWAHKYLPGIPLFSMWIKVGCSGGDGSGDPDNVCGDREDDHQTCPNPYSNQRPPENEDNKLQAYSNPTASYSTITFCEGFFKLRSLRQAIQNGKKKSKTEKRNLELWENRARCFFHEITHLTYFMNTPKKGPNVEEVQITYNNPRKYTTLAYGPENTKILTKYSKNGKGGFYTQRNADNYAWFAVANYINSLTKQYPDQPSPKQTPTDPPRDVEGAPFRGSEVDDKRDIIEDMGRRSEPSLDNTTMVIRERDAFPPLDPAAAGADTGTDSGPANPVFSTPSCPDFFK